MFENIGSKIKIMAKVFFWILIVCFGISAITMFVTSGSMGNQMGVYIMLGFIYLLLGPVIAYLCVILLYGFGELIDSNQKIAKHFDKNHGCFCDNQNNSSHEDIATNNTPTKVIGSCAFCNKTDVELTKIKIVDEMGTRYRNVCVDCAKNFEKSDK